MKESYSEGPASHAGPELYAGDGNIAGVATTGVRAGQVLSSENRNFRLPTLSGLWEGYIVLRADGEWSTDAAESKTLCMYGNSKRENREIPSVSTRTTREGRNGGMVRKHLRWYL